MANFQNRIVTAFIGLFLLAITLGITYSISFLDFKIGIVINFIIIVGIPAIYLSLSNAKWGVVFLTFAGFFIFLIAKLLPFSFPTGTIIDFIIVVTLIGIVFKEAKQRRFKFKEINNRITKTFLIVLAYNLLEIINPYGVSAGVAVMVIRGIVFIFLTFFVISYSLRSFKDIKKFTSLWLFLALLVGLYGIYQEAFGYADFEMRHINSIDGMYTRLFIWGHLRKFSFLSDVAAFGLFMGFTSIFSFILAFSDKISFKTKLYYLSITIISLLAMTYSGTRTAYVMVPIGLFLFFLLNMRNIKVIIASSFLVVTFLIILFGPFYSGPFRRLKSAFQPEDDPSMNARTNNINKIQPYIWSHPFGGGLMTTGLAGITYSPGHTLSGFPTDSGYLRVALETGWVGLLLTLVFYSIVVFAGIKGFFNKGDPLISNYIAAYTCAFFALSVANLTQDAMGQRPVGIIIIAIYAFIPILSKLNIAKNQQ